MKFPFINFKIMKKTITVTRKDLRNEYDRPSSCPIAQALKREFSTHNVNVGSATINIDYRKYYLPLKANEKAKSRANNLWGQIIGGFTFELEM